MGKQTSKHCDYQAQITVLLPWHRIGALRTMTLPWNENSQPVIDVFRESFLKELDGKNKWICTGIGEVQRTEVIGFAVESVSGNSFDKLVKAREKEAKESVSYTG